MRNQPVFVAMAVAFLAGCAGDGDRDEFRWPRGSTWTYDLALASDTDARVLKGGASQGGQDARIESRVDLRGRVELRSYGPRGDATRLGLRFVSLPEPVFEVLGEPLFPDPESVAAVLGREAMVDVTATGRILGVRFRPADPEPYRVLVGLVLAETQVRLGADPSAREWNADERTRLGTAPTRYARLDSGPAGQALRKVRGRIERLSALPDRGQVASMDAEGAWDVVVAPDAVVGSLVGSDRASARDFRGTELLRSTGSVSWTLAARGDFLPDDSAADDDRQVVTLEAGILPDAEDRRLRMMRQRAAGLTGPELLATLSRWAPTGAVPDQAAFLWRAVALLRLEPGLAEDVAKVACRADLDGDARGLVLDLLVGTGTSQAQAAIRAVLDDPRVRADRLYYRLFQRLSRVHRPDDDTVRRVRASFDQAGPEGWAPAYYAYGAVAGNLWRSGRKADGHAIAAEIAARLAVAGSNRERRVLLRSLGNAGIPGFDGDVRAWAADPDPNVRVDVAAALRRFRDDGVRDLLADLSADPEAYVQQRAMRSLMEAGMGRPQLGRLRDHVQAGRIVERNLGLLVSLLTPYLGAPESQEIARAILAMPLQDARVKGRVRVLTGIDPAPWTGPKTGGSGPRPDPADPDEPGTTAPGTLEGEDEP